MKLNFFWRLGAWWFLLALAKAMAQGLEHEGRWFHYNGEPIFLVGFDCQELASDPTIDITAALDAFAAHRINKVRIWLYTWFGGTSHLTPWARSGDLHDLDHWNPSYWTRMRDFVAGARERGIVVEINIFAPYPAADWWWDNPEFGVAWNKRFNVNNAFSSNSSGHFQPQFFDLTYDELSSSGKLLRDYQQDLVDKAVSELGVFDNVYFEVCNEFGTYDLDVASWSPWQIHWARRLDQTGQRLVAVHAGGGNEVAAPHLYWDEASVDVLNFRFNFGVSPQFISDALHDAQLKGKVLAVNESHSYASGGSGATDFYGDLDAETNYAWGLALSGAHIGFYEDDSSRIGSSGWVAGAERLRVLRELFERLRFWELSPVDASGKEYDGLVQAGPGEGWQVLARPGEKYLVFFWGEGVDDVSLELPSGEYRYEWIDPRDGRSLTEATVFGGGTAVLEKPAAAWSRKVGVALIVQKSTMEEPDGGATDGSDAGTDDDYSGARDGANDSDLEDPGSTENGEQQTEEDEAVLDGTEAGREGDSGADFDEREDGDSPPLEAQISGACSCRNSHPAGIGAWLVLAGLLFLLWSRQRFRS